MRARLGTSTSLSTAAPAGLTAAPAPWQVRFHSLFSQNNALNQMQSCGKITDGNLNEIRSLGQNKHYSLGELPLVSLVQTVSTSCAEQRGRLLTSPSNMWSTAPTRAPVMAETTAGCGSTHTTTASQTRPATTTRPETRVRAQREPAL